MLKRLLWELLLVLLLFRIVDNLFRLIVQILYPTGTLDNHINFILCTCEHVPHARKLLFLLSSSSSLLYNLIIKGHRLHLLLMLLLLLVVLELVVLLIWSWIGWWSTDGCQPWRWHHAYILIFIHHHHLTLTTTTTTTAIVWLFGHWGRVIYPSASRVLDGLRWCWVLTWGAYWDLLNWGYWDWWLAHRCLVHYWLIGVLHGGRLRHRFYGVLLWLVLLWGSGCWVRLDLVMVGLHELVNGQGHWIWHWCLLLCLSAVIYSVKVI